MYTNIRSIMNKRDELEGWVSENAPLIIGLTETWLCPEIADNEFVPEGYICFRSDRIECRKGGGVCLLVRADIPVTQLSSFSAEDGQYESIWCKVKLTKRRYDVIGVIYRTPGTECNQFFVELQEFKQYGSCLILGDFNAPRIDWINDVLLPGADKFTRELINTCHELHLYQHVQQPTRILRNEQSTLDLVISSNETDIQSIDCHSPLGKSDHTVLTFVWKRSELPAPTREAKANIWHIDSLRLREVAEQISWTTAKDLDIELQWNHFKETLLNIIKKIAPVKRQRAHHKGPPWFDKELRKALKKRNNAWKHYRITGEGYDYYKRIRNMCTLQKRAKRQEFEEKLAIDSIAAPKRFYAYMRRRTRAPTHMPTLQSDETDAETAEEKANVLAKQYASVYTDEPDVDTWERATRNATRDTENQTHPISTEEVLLLLKNLDVTKSPGPDNLHPLILKNLADIIAEPLTAIFNKSLSEGKLPTDWKQAIISPRFKGGDKRQPGNYRPISLTCIACKVIVTVLFNRKLS